MIPRSLKSLWQSDVILGASVGAVTSGVLVVLALVLAPMLGSNSERPSSNAPSGVASLPASSDPATRDARGKDGAAADSAGPTVTRREDTSSLPGTRNGGSDSAGERPQDGASQPAAPQEKITPVPVVPAPSAGGAAGSALGQAIVPSPTGALRLRVKAASFGRESGGDPQLKLTMGVSTPGPTATPIPEQVTVTLRPDIPSHPEREATPLALQAHVDVVEQTESAASNMGLRVRMSLAPATAEVTTIDESAEGDGRSNVVKLAIPLTAFDETKEEEAVVPGMPTGTPASPAKGDDGSGEGTSGEKPAEYEPHKPTETPVVMPPADPTPAEPAPAEPATPAEPSAPAEPTTPAEPSTPAEPAPAEPTTPTTPATPETPAEPSTPEPHVTEIQVPLIVTPQPITTVEKTVLPLPPEVAPDATHADGLRITVAVQNALTDLEDGTAGAAGRDPAAPADPAAPETPAEPAAPSTADPAPVPSNEPEAPATDPTADSYGAGEPELVSY